MAHYREIAHHVPMPTESPGPRAMTKTVLIVEDNELNMKLFHDLLDAHGYKTLQTRNGMEALSLAREHRPDLILMDIQLPGIDGYEATRRIKASEALRHIPLIVVTSYALSGDDAKALAAGADDYVAKPFSPRAMLAKVREYVK
jgi:two-component system cell cycle response regulator DivK